MSSERKAVSTKKVDVAVTAPQLFLDPSLFGDEFAVHELWKVTDAASFDRDVAPNVRALVATGHVKIDKDFITRFPALEILANHGVGYDRVDAQAAAERGVVVTNTPDVLTDDVADLTLGLLLATVRQLPQSEKYLRAGKWPGGIYPLTTSLQGRKVGVLGLGRIGRAVAKRCEAFNVRVAYFGRSRKADCSYEYFDTPLALAQNVDTLLITVSGGTETAGLVDAAVIDALGPQGILVNVSRGSVIDEAALIDALKTGRILSAGLDVFHNEPNVSPELIAMENVVLLPHVGSASVQTRKAMINLVVKNVQSWFAGSGPINPVAESLRLIK